MKSVHAEAGAGGRLTIADGHRCAVVSLSQTAGSDRSRDPIQLGLGSCRSTDGRARRRKASGVRRLCSSLSRSAAASVVRTAERSLVRRSQGFGPIDDLSRPRTDAAI